MELTVAQKERVLDLCCECVLAIPEGEKELKNWCLAFLEQKLASASDPVEQAIVSEAKAMMESMSEAEIQDIRNTLLDDEQVQETDEEFQKKLEYVNKTVEAVRVHYNEIEAAITKMAKAAADVFKDEKGTKSPEYFMFAFDILLQYSLLQLASMDNKIDPLEVLFIKNITKYGDFAGVLSKKYNEELDWTVFLNNPTDKVKKLLADEEPSVKSFMKNLVFMLAMFVSKLGEEIIRGFVENVSALISALVKIDADESEAEFINKIYLNKFVNDVAELADNMYKEFIKKKKEEVDFTFPVNQGGQYRCNYLDKPKRKAALLYIETDKGSGSGFVITQDGYAITCNHVIEGASKVFVRTEGLSRDVFKAEIIFADRDNDFALIKVDADVPLYFYEISEDVSDLEDGDDIALYGFPYGRGLNEDVMELDPSLAKGYISSRNRIAGAFCYYIDLRAMFGHSGGPIFDARNGRVIGYLCGSYGADRANICYMRSLEYFLDLRKGK